MSKGNIENFYPLSPAQQGILFHSLYQPESGVYFGQLLCVLRGDLNVSALRNSWQKVVDRHPILRTCFLWENLKEPVQAVRKEAALSWQQMDWRDLSAWAQQQQLETFLKADREQGFDLTSPPLIRLALAQLETDSFQFILSHHHLVLDGWSLAIVLKEFLAFYQAFSQGEELHLKRPRPYRDYLAWLHQQDLSAAESFWRQTLKGLAAPTAIGRGNIVAGHRLESRGEQQVIFSATSTAALQSLARQHQLTLNTLVQAAWALLLSRYSGEEDVLFGTVVSGRPPELMGAESVVGMFVNSLPVRVKIDPQGFILSCLKELQAQQVEARQYEYSPLIEVQGWSEVPRSLPLFESLVVFENYPSDASLQEKIHNLKVENIRSLETTNYPLTVTGVPGAELTLKIIFDRSCFEDSAIARMLGHLQVLLEGMAANPHQPLKNLPLLTPAEKQQILVEWNGTKADYPQDRCIHQLFEAQVDRTPDAIAVVFEDQKVTYRELNERANQLAHYLQQLGVKPEVLVGICVERSLLTIVGILGILKAGGAYVPLDPANPIDRTAFILQDASVSVLLTQETLLETLPEYSGQVVCLEVDSEAIAQNSTNNPHNHPTGENLAYVIYTSGSTGQPKGVLVTHANVVRLFAATQSWYNFSEGDVWTMFHSYAFDFSVWELWGALIYGGRLVIVPYFVARSPMAFYELLCRERVTVLNQTPSAFRQLMQAEESVEPGNNLSLRWVIFGGEALELPSLKPWFERHGDRSPQLVNMYGITETTVHVTYRPLSLADLNGQGSVIGCAIPDLQVYILDKNRQLVPVGIPGEMYVSGAGVARGYLNRPDLTAERFISNPFSEKKEARLYKTGDLARYLPNGDIEYLGRIDTQVKVRGFRIELGEIEETLRQHPAVQDAAAIARDDTSGNKRLVAYVVQNAGFQATNDTVAGSEWDAERISNWQSVFNDTYRQTPSDRDGIFNIVGWNSSYTDLPLSETEMREWLDLTIERILALQPQRVLEIGCGTGLLLFRIAPHCLQYWGADFSQIALDSIEQQLRSGEQNLPQVKLLHKEAQDFEGIEPESVDLVILNSVVQYFPSADYLLRVLSQAAKVVRNGGSIFIGDVRNLALLKAFHLSVQLHQASDDLPVAHLLQRVQKRIAQEQELILNPGFFSAFKRQFPNISSVQVQPKHGKFCNELTMFRYDVILRVGQETGEIDPPTMNGWIDWQQQELTLKSARQLLEETQPDAIGFRRVPNARLNSEMKALELLKLDSAPQTVGQLKELLQSLDSESGINSEALSELGQELQYSVEISWLNGSPDGSYDAIFYKAIAPSFSQTSGFSRKALNAFANNPLQGKADRELVPQLRGYLQEKLPEYMVPSAFVMLESLPLTPNGKLDRRALPQKCDRVSEKTAFTEPQTPTEKELAQIWMAVLELEEVGINESFFDIGGHSLMAMQLVSRVRMRLGVDLALSDVYAAPTIQSLAELVEEEILANADSNQIDELLDRLEKIDGESAQTLMLNE
jgi:amino acid adenylation domain-containing protein